MIYYSVIIFYFIITEYKTRKKDKKIMNDWYDAQDNVDAYTSAFISKSKNNLQGTIGTSLEEIDMISPYETATYRSLMRECHRTYIAYAERKRNRYALDKERLILLLKEIKDDESLSDRAMRLIFLI